MNKIVDDRMVLFHVQGNMHLNRSKKSWVTDL